MDAAIVFTRVLPRRSADFIATKRRVLNAFLISCLSLFTLCCKQLPRDVQAVPAEAASNNNSTYGPPVRVGTIRVPGVVESSGLAASRTDPGVYWTHNDSGDGPFIYAFDQAGRTRGVWRVAGATAVDWEDMAAGPGLQPNRSYLYLGDIGDNESSRSEIVVYSVPEPEVVAADPPSTKGRPRLTESAQVFRLRYPDGKHDAETLLVHPVTGNLYIVTKIPFENPSVYEAVAPLNSAKVTTMKRVGQLAIPSLAGGVLTGGAISPDGTRIGLCDYFQGYEVVLPSGSKSFDEIWKERISTIDIGNRKQGEAITYRLDGRALVTSSEGASSPLIEVVRRQ